MTAAVAAATPTTADGHPREGAGAATKTVATLALLGVALPVNLAVTAATLLHARIRPRPPATAGTPRTILISGGKMTKALQLARLFHRAGHRVVLVEAEKYRVNGHRFSTAVERFYAVPTPDAPEYARALLDIVRAEGVDVYVPVCSPVASYYDALAKETLAGHCEVVHVDADLVRRLDDKAAFAELAASLGLSVPETHRITDPHQVLDFDFASRKRSFILKSIDYDPVRRLDLTLLPRPTAEQTAAFVADLPISESNPWILQEFIPGREYCTHGTMRGGELAVYCCSDSSPFQINYAALDKPEIERWVRRFAAATKVTGQLSFDFIEAEDGGVYAIECNPRTHSAITAFHDHTGVAPAYLEDGAPPVTPNPGARPTYWLYHELWRLLSNPLRASHTLRTVLAGKDAIYDTRDPLPFLMVYQVQIPWLLLKNLRAGRSWIRIDFNIGKLVEMAGD